MEDEKWQNHRQTMDEQRVNRWMLNRKVDGGLTKG